MRERVLVTGGMGFIGSNFVRYMLRNHPETEIIVLDKLTYAGNPANLADLEGMFDFVRGDVADSSVVDPLVERCDSIVHFAAETHVDRSIAHAGDFVKTDIYGTFTLLEAARKYGVDRFVHISTDEVYGEAVDHPSLETDELAPKSPYAASKAGADRLVFSYFATYGIPAVISRCANNYGPYQYPEKLIPLFVTNALEGKKLPVYGHGRNIRDWIHVEDHCSAIDAMLQSDGYNGETFNVSANEEKNVLEIADIILKTLGLSDELIEHVADRPGHVMRHAVDATKLQNTYDWKPSHDFENSMRRTIKWYANNPEWWRPIRSGEFRRYYEKQYTRM